MLNIVVRGDSEPIQSMKLANEFSTHKKKIKKFRICIKRVKEKHVTSDNW